jgi:hypothetical protein
MTRRAARDYFGRTLCYVTLLLSTTTIVGCKDKYQEGYDQGYAEGLYQGKRDAEKQCEEKIDEEKKSCRDRSYSSSYSSSYSTEVCGGGGVNLNGKHYEGGKTGCVRVYSDGRVVRY